MLAAGIITSCFTTISNEQAAHPTQGRASSSIIHPKHANHAGTAMIPFVQWDLAMSSDHLDGQAGAVVVAHRPA
jgi:hypothetical protein